MRQGQFFFNDTVKWSMVQDDNVAKGVVYVYIPVREMRAHANDIGAKGLDNDLDIYTVGTTIL